MMITPDEAREYLRATIDEIDDDAVNGYITAAEQYLTNAGCALNSDDELAKLAVKMLVVQYYENRDPESRSSGKLDAGLKSIILQLQTTDPAGDAS